MLGGTAACATGGRDCEWNWGTCVGTCKGMPGRRRYRRHVHRFLCLRRGDRQAQDPEDPLDAGDTGRGGHAGHRRAGPAPRAAGLRYPVFHPRHHGGREHRDPAPGRGAGAVHDAGIRGRAGGRAAEDARPLRHLLAPAAAAGAARAGLRHRRAGAEGRLGRNAGRSRRCAGRGSEGKGGGRGHDRCRPAARLRQPGERARGPGRDPGGGARHGGDALLGRLAGHPGI